MNRINFTKMHGLGNDFIVLDFTQEKIELSTTQIKFLANRQYGIGCDQVLVIEQSNTTDYDFIYRIYNADGTHAHHCGNGARCVIKYLYTHHKITHEPIRLKIKDKIINGIQNSDLNITINTGTPKFNPIDIPFNHKINTNNIYSLKLHNKIIECGVVSVGNPHVIVRLFDVAELSEDKTLKEIATILQSSKYFPDGVNVNFYVPQSVNSICMRTYERGSGFTLACGTGATATACYAIQQQQSGNSVSVSMPGGILNIYWDGLEHEATLTGPAIEVFQGQIEL